MPESNSIDPTSNVYTKSDRRRFWEKVDKSGECWVWTACRMKTGYGRIGVMTEDGYKSLQAHRVSWELTYGPIPPGKHVLHRCDNPPCVRPNHLFLGDQAANMADKGSKGRHPRGAESYKAQLTWEQAEEIRRRYTPHIRGSVKALADEFGVYYMTICRIGKGKIYKKPDSSPLTAKPEVSDCGIDGI